MSDADVPVCFSSEQSIAHFSKRPTVSRCLLDDIKLIWKHQPQKTQIYIVTNVPFIQTRSEWQCWPQAQVYRAFFQLLQYSSQRPSFLAHSAPLMTRTDWHLSAFSLRFVDFTQFNTDVITSILKSKTKEPLRFYPPQAQEELNLYLFTTCQLNNLLCVKTNAFWISKLWRCVA